MNHHRTTACFLTLTLLAATTPAQYHGTPHERPPAATPPAPAAPAHSAPTGHVGDSGMLAEEALHRLKLGNQRFAAGRSERKDTSEETRRVLAKGQSPFAIVLTCADSRVPPEHVFNAGLGELFVVRVAGNVCEPSILASIEYAAEHLGTQLCVVMGHEKCGAVKAASDSDHRAELSPQMKRLLEHIDPAVRKARRPGPAGTDWLSRAEEENAYDSLADIMRGSKTLQGLAEAGRFKIVAARYQLGSGTVDWLPERPWREDAATPPQSGKVETPKEHAAMPGFVALGRLRAGHRRFFYESQSAADVGKDRRELVADGQKPIAVVVTCADSRVSPEWVFDAGLGELFVVRVAGNVLTDENLASIEYAVEHLDTRLLVVMGHESCGAVKAATATGNESELSPSMRDLMARLEPSVVTARAEGLAGDRLVSRAVELNVLRFLSQVRSRSKTLREMEKQGELQLAPCVYELKRGDLRWLKETERMDLSQKTPPAAPAQPARDHAAAPHR